MKRPSLTVQKRDVLGKKIKRLRKTGVLPANIYGKDVESLAVQVPYKEFEAVFKDTGETGLIDVVVDGQARPALIHNVQYHHVTRIPLHADFYQVNLKEKVKTMIPVVTLGEPKAVTEKVGLLLQPVSEIEVEALPADLPEKIEVNVENLAAVDEQITVADLKISSDVTVLTDSAQVVVKIGELVTKEAAQEAAQEAAAAEAAKAEGEEETAAEKEGAEEKASAEGEDKTKVEESSKEEKSAEEKKE
ncbi:MAG: 50S ribosomal protein L25 [Candidatus Levybacteria bacterium]|nr:50S ribosomal protein L25 [Candidatus Levybacteria bacterium]